MADNRKINQGVRVGKEVVTDPDKLEEVMTPDMAKRLADSGAISGDFKPKGKAKKEEK